MWEDVVQSESFLLVLASAVTALWTFFKSCSLWEKRKGRRLAIAVQALEAAVEATYRNYVRHLKQNREGGKLSEAEAEEARRRAQETATILSREEGVDLVATLGADYLDLWINRLVRKMK